MAEIRFDAFVEDVISGPSGPFALKVAEPHSRKDEAGKWQTIARTFRTVKASRDSGVDFGAFSKGDRISVAGAEKTEVREYQGKKFYDLVVWAESVQSRGGQPATAAVPVQSGWETPADYTDSTPF
jgi:hypothetical protein